jgi:orotate phosphoribosyltransferase
VEAIDTLGLLERGGALRRGHFQQASGHTDLIFEKYSGLVDPAGARTLGGALARRLVDFRANVVVVWQDVEDLVLGFVVAGEIGCGLVRAYNADGLVGHSPDLPTSARALLVTDCVRNPNAVRAVRALLEARGGALLGVGALADGEPVEGVAAVSLVQVPTRTFPPESCPLCQQGIPLHEAGRGGSARDGIR